MQRRAECNLGDLVEKLTTSYEENTKGIVAGFEENTKGIVAALGRIHDIVNATADDGGQSQLTLTILQNGEGDKTKTTGLPWNPMSALGEYVTAPATCACAWCAPVCPGVFARSRACVHRCACKASVPARVCPGAVPRHQSWPMQQQIADNACFVCCALFPQSAVRPRWGRRARDVSGRPRAHC